MKKKEIFTVRRRNPKKDSKKIVKLNPNRKVKVNDLLERALMILNKVEAMKDFYKELDEVLEMLIEAQFTEGKIKGRRIVLKDTFASKNLKWKSTPTRRYELELA